MTHQLPPMDPHDPAISAAALARHLDDVVRALNYATRPGDPRLGNVPDAYAVLGALHEAMAKLPQACTQIAAGLHRHESTGWLRAEQRWPHAGQPREAVIHAAALLGDAAEASATAAESFGRAQAAISGLSHDQQTPKTARRARLAEPAQRQPAASGYESAGTA